MYHPDCSASCTTVYPYASDFDREEQRLAPLKTAIDDEAAVVVTPTHTSVSGTMALIVRPTTDLVSLYDNGLIGEEGGELLSPLSQRGTERADMQLYGR